MHFKTVSVVILLVRIKTAALQRTLPHVTLQAISVGLYARFIRIERKTA